MTRIYYIYCNNNDIELDPDWDSAAWSKAGIAEIDQYHPHSSEHRPETSAKILYTPNGIHLLFRVHDKYVRSIHTQYNAKVNEDSCVEWFIRPKGAEGYYNFEMNAGGTLHVNYIVDPERDSSGKRKDIRSIPYSHARQVIIKSSMPKVIDPEIEDEVLWTLAMFIPFTFFDLYTPLEKINGSIWQGNLYKCGDKTSRPHWGSWSPVEKLNFHQPHHFGEFIFKEDREE